MKQSHKWAVVSSLLMAAGGAAFAQEQPQEPQPAQPADGAAPGDAGSDTAAAAKEVLLQSQAAIRRAQAITYHAKYAPTGGMANYMSTAEGDVRMVRTPRAWLVRSVGTGQGKSGDPVNFDVAWLENSTEWVDHVEKKVFEKRKNDAKGDPYRFAVNTKVDDLIDPSPFKTELSSKSILRLKDRQEVGGVMCDVVESRQGQAKASTNWYIGVNDRMPRKRETVFSSSAASGTVTLELSDLTVDETNPPRMPEEMTRVEVPEGYAEERVAVAPAPAPVPPPAPPVTPDASSPVATAETAPPPVPEIPRVRSAPEFELKTPSGETVTTASLRGKVAVLEFGGSWCISFREAHPELEALAQQYKDRAVVVYLVNVREKSAANIIDDMRKAGNTFGLLLDGDAVATAFGIKRYPTYCVIDKDGMVQLTEAGFVKNSTMAVVGEAVEAALGNGPGAEAKRE